MAEGNFNESHIADVALEWSQGLGYVIMPPEDAV